MRKIKLFEEFSKNMKAGQKLISDSLSAEEIRKMLVADVEKMKSDRHLFDEEDEDEKTSGKMSADEIRAEEEAEQKRLRSNALPRGDQGYSSETAYRRARMFPM